MLMFKFNKSTFILVISLLILTAFVLPVFSVDLPFDPNDYTFLVYDPTPSDHWIQDAMEHILGRQLNQNEIRTSSNPVTPNDLATHDILIVGFNRDGYTDGLHTDDLSAGITGRILLTGHDLDHHESEIPAARTMLIQSINYVLEGGGTGLVAMECTSNYSYLPKDDWGIDSIYGDGEYVNEFTPEGLASGVFDGLHPHDDPNSMSYWYTSYHNTFDINEQTSEFVPFELGGDDYNDIITIARISPPIDANLAITDDTNSCVYPSISDVNYTIHWSAGEDINDVNLVSELSEYTEFVSCTGNGDYNESDRTVTWNLGDRDANDSNDYTLLVSVNSNAPQGFYITNRVRMYSGDTLIKTDAVDTNICCMDTAVYVDAFADEGGDGRTWATAYNSIQQALSAINNGEYPCCDQIWVADGNYFPTDNPDLHNATFEMIPGISIYGHFEGGWETSIDARNLADSNLASVLNGDVNGDGTSDIDTIVTAANNSKLDGFTIRKGRQGNSSGSVYCNNVSAAIENCIIKENSGYGIKCYIDIYDVNRLDSITNCIIKDNQQSGVYCRNYNGDDITLKVLVSRCTIQNNPTSGIESVNKTELEITDSVITGNNGTGMTVISGKLTVQNCNVTHNSGDGINFDSYSQQIAVGNSIISGNNYIGINVHNALQSDISHNIISDNNSLGIEIGGASALIQNNWIYNNGSRDGYSGIYTGTSAEIRNNTIVKNRRYGIYRAAGDPNVNSNIIYYNTSGQLSDSYFTKVKYNCIQNCTETNGDINDLPEFVDSDSNDFHLTNDSNCIDAGNPNFTSSTETDIDGEDRILNNRVDIGADEFNPYDLSGEDGTPDGFINFFDFAVIANSWQTHTGQQSYNALCNFYDDGATDYINYKDLFVFCQYWLTPEDWQGIGGDGAYFADTGTGQMQMMMQQPSLSPQFYIGSSSSLLESEPIDVNSLVDWLDDLWQSDKDVQDSIDEKDWEEFIESIKSSQ